MTLPLKGVRILDFSHLLPGELATSLLADMGAELFRIERLEPGLVKHLPPIVKGESLYYWSLHRDEKRLALDLKKPEAVELVLRLVKDADVLLENFRPGVMARLGLGYERLKEINPRLLYCSISSYGQDSAWNQRPGHDINLQAETGLLHVGRDAEGQPVLPGVLASDFMSGMFAAMSVVAAVHERTSSASGRHLDISMFGSTMYLQALVSTAQQYMSAELREADPAFRNGLANYNVYKCKDGRYVAVGSLEIPFWKTLCERIGRPDLAGVMAFGPNAKLKGQLQDEFAKKDLAEWMEIFAGHDCCVSPVNTVAEALEYLPFKERARFANLVHPVLGEVPQLRAPLPFKQDEKERVANTDIAASSAAALAELGLSPDEIARLQSAKVIPASQVARV